MINNSYRTGMLFMLKMQSLESLMMFSSLFSLKEVWTAYEELNVLYKEKIKTPQLSKNVKVPKETIHQLISATSKLIKATMQRQTRELARKNKRKNVLESLQLGKELAGDFMKQLHEALLEA